MLVLLLNCGLLRKELKFGFRADDKKSDLKVAAHLAAADQAVGVSATASAAGDRGGVARCEEAAGINRGAEIGSACATSGIKADITSRPLIDGRGGAFSGMSAAIALLETQLSAIVAVTR